MKRIFNYDFIFVLGCFLCALPITACSPKFIIRGEIIRGTVVDNDTAKPIGGAAGAIRWLRDSAQHHSSNSTTLKAAQVVSDARGFFKIPVFHDRDYAMGVYKKGYVCWSSNEDFFKEPAVKGIDDPQLRTHPQLKDGFEIRLKPFSQTYSREQHAGFVVLVAGECTDTHSGPFIQAIESEYELWRNTLRKNFQNVFEQKLGRKPTPAGAPPLVCRHLNNGYS